MKKVNIKKKVISNIGITITQKTNEFSQGMFIKSKIKLTENENIKNSDTSERMIKK